MFKKVFVRENLSCVSKIELPYYSVAFYKKIWVWCGVSGTSRMLGDAVEKYPKCTNCQEKPDVLPSKAKSSHEKRSRKEEREMNSEHGYFSVQSFLASSHNLSQ